MSSDTTRARTVRRLGWLLGDGRWRVRTVDPEMNETTVDLTDRALQARLDVAENRLLGAKKTLDNKLERTRHPHFGAAMTRDELVSAVRDDLLEVYAWVIGVKTS